MGCSSLDHLLDSIGDVPRFPQGFADGLGLDIVELGVVVAEFHDGPQDVVVHGGQVERCFGGLGVAGGFGGLG